MRVILVEGYNVHFAISGIDNEIRNNTFYYEINWMGSCLKRLSPRILFFWMAFLLRIAPFSLWKWQSTLLFWCFAVSAHCNISSCFWCFKFCWSLNPDAFKFQCWHACHFYFYQTCRIIFFSLHCMTNYGIILCCVTSFIFTAIKFFLLLIRCIRLFVDA